MHADAFPRLIEGLLRPDAYPGAGPGAAVTHLETHISHVFLVGERAYKLKKPIDLGFLDFSTLERRRQFCEEEVRLNRRLAPDLYLGVLPIGGTPNRPRVGAAGEVLEYAVAMHRFPQSSLLDRCPLSPALIDRIAERLADFHAAIPRTDPAGPYGTPEAVLEPMIENLNQVRERVDDAACRARLDRLEDWTRHRWRDLTPIIERRREEGRVRECHGDLHRANIAACDGEPLFFDALEFNPALRWIDTASELAFLLMDLDSADEAGLARRLLNRYLELCGDYGALRVLRFYQVYRAMVRAKVTVIRLGQAITADEAGREAARRACADYLDLAERYTEERRPRLLLACGLSGSGKSRLARQLREALPVIHLRSDLERKRLFGLPPEAPTETGTGTGFGSGIYFPQATEWTYQRLGALAAQILGAGFDVMVDATFLNRARREAFRRLARGQGAGYAVLALYAPMSVLRERIARRLAEGRDASEATVEVLEQQAAASERLTRTERLHAMTIKSTDPPPLDQVLERIAEVTGVALGE